MSELRLEVREFVDLTRWRWVLSTASGTFLADHEVRLDAGCWEYEAFTDLLRYLQWHVAPDRKAEDEARIVAETGAWIGSQVLGPLADALVEARPATVRVVVPSEARAMLFWPLELARAGGGPLAVQDATLVMEAGPPMGGDVSPVGSQLRVLGLFSLPEGGQPLNLRRERHSLVRLIRGIAAAGKAADVRVLQYGVTRERLRDVLEEAEGWDVIHISGHGTPGELLLEDAAGRPDRVTAADLAEMLDLARERVKLVTVAACWSAALTAAEQRRRLRLPVPGARATDVSSDGSTPGALATELAERLGCAVLAMRYPVDDDFAIALTGKLYHLLAEKGQPLPRAVGMTLRQLMTLGSWSALSVATPTLFGGRAVDLRLAAPRRVGVDSYDAMELKLAGFPAQPDRFVGRTAVMARSSAALAAESRVPGVLLHGMPGGGKTACALELAYTHEHAFDRLVWYKAPDEGSDIRGALTDFALALEQLPGFQMVHLVADSAKLTAFLPRLAELVEQRRVLIVIDNIESLLTSAGEWRDDRWGEVIGALSAHSGLGRVVLTSRCLPARVDEFQVEAVDALSLDEALLLARELPHLHDLIKGELPNTERDLSRQLALGVLNIAQGHPKLLELADGQAAHPEQLAELIKAGDRAWRDKGGLPESFFLTGETSASSVDYLHVLDAWTQTVTEALPLGERALFRFLCCLEEPDRERPVLDGNWSGLWSRIGLDAQPPAIDHALTMLAAKGLISVQHDPESYAIHPGVAAAGQVQAGKQYQDAVDTEVSAFWFEMLDYALGETGDGDAHTGLMMRAGLAAVPYLMRGEKWMEAAVSLGCAFSADPSRSNAATMLPIIQEIVAHDPEQTDVLTRILQVIDSAQAEIQLRASVDTAVECGDYRAASVTTGFLIELCQDSGRLADALSLADKKLEYSRRAKVGPWTQIADEIQRLHVLDAMGKADLLSAEVQQLRDRILHMPSAVGEDEEVSPWNVREELLLIGIRSAQALRHWKEALSLNAELIAGLRTRGASDANIARLMFNDHEPLLELGRTDEALDLLLHCRQVFHDAYDIKGLGKVFTALASAEAKRNHFDAAITLERDALRYEYLAGDVLAIAHSYENLGIHLCIYAEEPAAALACHLAAALIRTLSSAAGTDHTIFLTAFDMTEPSTDATVPADVADLCHYVGDIPGTDLSNLLAALSPDPAAAERALRDLIAQAQALAATVST